MALANIIIAIVALIAAAVNKLSNYDPSERVTIEHYVINRSSNDILFTALILNIIVSLLNILQ